MKKLAILSVILVIAVFSISLASSQEYLGTRERVEKEGMMGSMMEKRYIEDVSDRPSKPMIHSMHVSGKGLAVNPIDLNDFSQAAIVIGRVAIPNGTIEGKGMMQIARVKYRISNIILNEGKLSADILNAETRTDIGNLNLERKSATNIWHGIAAIDGKDWHIYLLNVHRNFNREELAEKARDYCKDNPSDSNCNAVAGYTCKDNEEECKEKVERFCQDHADDSRCKYLLERYCRLNPEDTRCQTTTTTVSPGTLTPIEPTP